MWGVKLTSRLFDRHFKLSDIPHKDYAAQKKKHLGLQDRGSVKKDVSNTQEESEVFPTSWKSHNDNDVAVPSTSYNTKICTKKARKALEKYIHVFGNKPKMHKFKIYCVKKCCIKIRLIHIFIKPFK